MLELQTKPDLTYSGCYTQTFMSNFNNYFFDIVSKFENIFIAFSGGKDSCLVLDEVSRLIEVTALFVDTGVEFPDVEEFARNFCKERNVEFRKLEAKRKFFDIYDGKFPDPIFKDCISRIINITINEELRKFEKALLIRGGDSKQTNSNRRRQGNQFFCYQKTERVFLMNPLMEMSEAEKKEKLSKLELWPGYKKGFKRTACWCCPFQKVQQWEAMKTHTPELFEKMKQLATTWIFPNHPSGNSHYSAEFIRFEKYWKNKQLSLFEDGN